MPKKTFALLSAVLLAGIILTAACSPAVSTTPTPDANAVITQAAGTVAAQLTQSAALVTPSPSATNPPLPTDTVLPAATQAEQPAPPQSATNTPAATATLASAPASSTADNASFVADVTIPDGTGAAPGAAFTKTWRIKNTGTTTWTANYSLVPIDGERMGSPDSIPMPKEVRPGEEVEISVKLTAPSKNGSYQTFFRLRNASGQYFRLDKTGDLWVKIAVGGVTATPNMAETAEATPEVPTATPTK